MTYPGGQLINFIPSKDMSSPKAVFLTLGIYPGGPTRLATEVRAQQNLAALRALNYDLTIVTAPDAAGRPLAENVVLVEPPPINNFVRMHTRWRYRRQIRRQVAQLVTGPDTIIFCEHWAALLCVPRHPRVVYSFHDFESNLVKVRRLRKSSSVTWKTRAYWGLADWLERRLLLKAKRVISVSASEAIKLHDEFNSVVEYIPTVPLAEPVATKKFNDGPLRLWLYGSSGATSNKVILDHLIDKLFTPLSSALPGAEFHQAGSYQTYDVDKIEWLREHFHVHGFVDEPALLFRPGDICLMPYQQDTGFRTKIPEVCGYGMICAGYAETFACCPEMRDGYNCIIAETPDALVKKMASVAGEHALRERLAAGAIETSRRDFSFAALLERYRRILSF